MIALARSNPTANVILLFLIRNMDDRGAVVISQGAIADILGYSIRTISRAITYLKENNFVKTAKTGTSIIYHINAHIANVDQVKKGRAGKFSAAVILCSDEMKLSGQYDVD